MPVFPEPSLGRGYPDAAEHLYGKLAGLALRSFFMFENRLGYLIAYRQDWVERRHGLLKDH
jgi:hypothetical protein